MKDKTLIIVICCTAVILGLIGYFTVNPIRISKKTNNNSMVTMIDMKTISYNVKITSDNNNEEKESLIKVKVSFEKDNNKNELDFDLTFNKDSGELINKGSLDEIIKDYDDEFKNIINDVINKCVNEKLYNVNKLSMSYSSYYSTNK